MSRRVQFFVDASKGSRHERGLLAVAELVPLGDDSQRDARSRRQFTLPVGLNANSKPQTLQPGRYLAQVRMPEGKTLSEIVDIAPGASPLDFVIGRRVRERRVSAPFGAPRTANSLGPRSPDAEFGAKRVYAPPPTYEASDISFAATPSRGTLTRPLGELFSAQQIHEQLTTFADRHTLSVVHTHVATTHWSAELRDRAQLPPEQFVRGILGDPLVTARAPQKEDGRLTLEWDREVGDRFDSPPENRTYLSLRPLPDTPGRMYVASVPPIWRDPATNDPRKLHVEAVPIRGAPDRASIAIRVDDPATQSLLSFMQQGNLSAALSILDDSIRYLRSKFSNPYAAAAAGYCLVLTPEDRMSVNWEEWIGNLAEYFPDVPDGDILHATLLLQSAARSGWPNSNYFPSKLEERKDLAAKRCVSALLKGPPIYRHGLAFLASNLRILLGDQRAPLSREQRVMLTNAERAVSWMNMRVSPLEAFTVLDVSQLFGHG